MRHRYNKLKTLKTWVVKRDLVIRNLITSLIKHGQIKTTPKKAKILKSEIDKIFNKILQVIVSLDLESKNTDVKSSEK